MTGRKHILKLLCAVCSESSKDKQQKFQKRLELRILLHILYFLQWTCIIIRKKKVLNCKSSWFFPVINEEGLGTDRFRELWELVIPDMTTWASGAGRPNRSQDPTVLRTVRKAQAGWDLVEDKAGYIPPHFISAHFSSLRLLCAVMTSTPYLRAKRPRFSMISYVDL